jgi:hypothetical protein
VSCFKLKETNNNNNQNLQKLLRVRAAVAFEEIIWEIKGKENKKK